MAEPVLVSSDPAANAVGVHLNKAIKLVFQDDLDPATVNENTVQLIDRATQKRVGVSISYANKTITLLPENLLKENTLHRIIIVGDDLKVTQSLSGTGTADDLTKSIVLEFTTGDDLFEIDTTLEKEAQSKTLEGDLFLPSNVKALGYEFTVSTISPKNHTANNPVNLTGDRTVRFTFSKAIDTGTSPSLYVDIDIFPLFSDDYIASGELYKVDDTTNSVDWTEAVPTTTVSGSDLIVTFNKDLFKNVGVEIKLKNNIQSTSGDSFAGLNYVIATETLPKGAEPRTVKRELRHLGGDMLYDDYIAALSLKNSILLWEQTARALAMTGSNFTRDKYILYATILDIIEDQEYEKFMAAGSRQQVGDLNLAVDSLIGRLAMKAISAQREKDRAFESLHKGWQFLTVTPPQDTALEVSRLWYGPSNRYVSPIYKYYQPSLPISNVQINRHAKTNNPLF